MIWYFLKQYRYWYRYRLTVSNPKHGYLSVQPIRSHQECETKDAEYLFPFCNDDLLSFQATPQGDSGPTKDPYAGKLHQSIITAEREIRFFFIPESPIASSKAT